MNATHAVSEADVAADLQQSLPCPLCDYDLRGLPAGRCPECGHAFDPAEVRRAQDARHPYLFEHHARRFWWSLPRTWLGMAMPGRFWRTLRPEMPVRRRPLMVFAVLMTVLAGMLLTASPLSHLFEEARFNRQRRMGAVARYAALTESERAALDAPYRLHGNMGYLQAHTISYPPMTSPRFWSQVSWDFQWSEAIVFATTTAAWPWLTLASLMIFRQSLRQARVERGHLLRCCAYSSLPLVGIVPLGIGYTTALGSDYGPPMPATLPRLVFWQFLHIDPATFLAALTAFALCGYALWQAYRHYLRFPHAFATVLASQVVVVLTVLTILTLAPRW